MALDYRGHVEMRAVVVVGVVEDEEEMMEGGKGMSCGANL